MTSEPYFQSILKDCKADLSKNQSTEFYYSPDKIRALINQERQAEYDYYQEMKKHEFNIFQVYPFLEQTERLNSNHHSHISPAN